MTDKTSNGSSLLRASKVLALIEEFTTSELLDYTYNESILDGRSYEDGIHFGRREMAEAIKEIISREID